MPKGLNDAGIKNVTKTHAKSSFLAPNFAPVLPYFVWAIFVYLSLFIRQQTLNFIFNVMPQMLCGIVSCRITINYFY